MVFTPINKSELQTAVDLWISNNTTAVANHGDINTWDTSLITDMSDLFKDKYSFNDDISGWNVSNVTDMRRMFHTAQAFNQPIGNWNVSNVSNMKEMFANTQTFNKAINKKPNVTMNGSTYTA